MKKLGFVTVLLVSLLVSFLAGSWYHSVSVGKDRSMRVGRMSPAAGNVSVGEADMDDGASLAPGTIQVSPARQQTMGVRLDTVKKVADSHLLRVLGRVAADETRIYRVNTAVSGWIRELYDDNTTGSLVKKDQILATFFAAETIRAQQSYIYAVGITEPFKSGSSGSPQQSKLTEQSLQQALYVLRDLGMSDTQIAEIMRSRQYTENIQIRSPAEGCVVARNVSPGLRFEKGAELYRIVDLKRVWVQADVFEQEVRYLQPGKIVQCSLSSGGKAFPAKVSNVLPLFDALTRTFKVRLEADNPSYLLRPDMFVDIELPITFPPAIVVSADAVLDSGLRKTVFVSRGKGFFEPREVETGWRFGNRVEIVKGLKAGERIVASSNFFIDSESRMELTAAGIYENQAVDPVCGTDVFIRQAEKAGRKSVYQGKSFYFSSDDCKQKFDGAPARYGKNTGDRK